MRRQLFAFVVGGLLTAAGGCGTALNMRDGDDLCGDCANGVPARSVYGGVRVDVQEAAGGVVKAFTGVDRNLTSTEADPRLKPGERVAAPLLGLLRLCDVPFSLVGDTVMLPIVAWESMDRSVPRSVREGNLAGEVVKVAAPALPPDGAGTESVAAVHP
jgi:uncharacterized protein YceK